MSALLRLVEGIVGQYRWGLHPLKVFIALLLPLAIVWLADRWLRGRTRAIEEEEARLRRLPRAARH